jgi:D-3-phosphoglycerate dehydrogenase
MATYRVVVTDYVFESFDTEREALAELDAELVLLQCKTPEQLVPHLPGTHVLLNTYMPGVDERIFHAAPDLKAVVRYGVGVETIDMRAATRHGVMVVNVPDYCVEEVADHALALFLTLARKTCLANARVKAGEWSFSHLKPLHALAGMRAGVIGFGRIGRAIAGRLRAFGIQVCFADPGVHGDTGGATKVRLNQLLETAQAIFVQCSANEQTYHLIGRGAIKKMKNRPLLINAARGPIVDIDAVVWGLMTHRLGGAGLDVLEDHNAVVSTDHPLKHLPNVVLTPHTAWYSDAALRKLQAKAVAEVVRVLEGEKPLSLLNPEVLEKVE